MQRFNQDMPDSIPARKLRKTMINMLTSAHLGFFKTTLFGEADILDLARLGLLQIVFGSKAAVKADLKRISTIDLFLPVQHRDRQAGIRRIAGSDHTVQDQIGGSARQADLMAVERIPTILDDDIGMRFEDRYHFFLSRNGFAQT